MTIGRYIFNLKEQASKSESIEEQEAIKAKIAYAMAYKNGEQGLKNYRDRAIVSAICRKYSRDDQLAILFNEKTKPEEYAVYQAFRAECKATVDARMECYKKEIEASVQP